MKLGIMQPYFFPYIGYFQLMSAVDQWVVFDDIQFIDKGWVNRNRILHPDPEKEWQFITLPLDKRGQFDKICDIAIKEDINWRAQIMGKLTSYKKKAPYYKSTIDFIENCFNTDETNLAKFVIRILRMTAEHIGIDTPIMVQSEMNLQLGEIEHPGQWALRISEELGATEYINPYGGIDIFREAEFQKVGISLLFFKSLNIAYSQKRKEGFVPGLSIIDILMFNDHERCLSMLEQYKILPAYDCVDIRENKAILPDV